MGLKTRSTRWFQILTGRSHLTAVVDLLAQAGNVQLEVVDSVTDAPGLDDLHECLREFEKLSRRYESHWPQELAEPQVPGLPLPALLIALDNLRHWKDEAKARIFEIDRLRREEVDLHLLQDMYAAAETPLPSLWQLDRKGPILWTRLFLIPPGQAVPAFGPEVLVQEVPHSSATYTIVVAAREKQVAIERAFAAVDGRSANIPHSVAGPSHDLTGQLTERAAEVGRLLAEQEGALAELGVKYDLARVLGTMVRLRWYLQHVPVLPNTRNLVLVTGWTSDPDGRSLRALLQRLGREAVVEFPEPPPGLVPPTIRENPLWARPFELFPSLLGAAKRNEVDPSIPVTLIAPVVFGFMFADLGQGLVLTAVGLVLSKRIPSLRILIFGGLLAAVFGLLFGSVFALEDQIPALWMHPLHHPLTVLVTAIALGVLILTAGQLLEGLNALWSGRLQRWLLTDAAVLFIYLSIVTTPLFPRAFLLAPIGVLWHLLGTAVTAEEQRAMQVAAAAGHLLETMLQRLVNTVSFLRVGAFALAHAGLSGAIVAMAHALKSTPGFVLVLVLGNLFTVALEGLIVGIQTTRLMLFEFFVRFYKGEGRSFSPLLPAPKRS